MSPKHDFAHSNHEPAVASLSASQGRRPSHDTNRPVPGPTPHPGPLLERGGEGGTGGHAEASRARLLPLRPGRGERAGVRWVFWSSGAEVHGEVCSLSPGAELHAE